MIFPRDITSSSWSAVSVDLLLHLIASSRHHFLVIDNKSRKPHLLFYSALPQSIAVSISCAMLFSTILSGWFTIRGYLEALGGYHLLQLDVVHISSNLCGLS